MSFLFSWFYGPSEVTKVHQFHVSEEDLLLAKSKLKPVRHGNGMVAANHLWVSFVHCPMPMPINKPEILRAIKQLRHVQPLEKRQFVHANALIRELQQRQYERKLRRFDDIIRSRRLA